VTDAQAPPGCRFCGAPLRRVFADLRSQPLANSYLWPAQLSEMEPFYPLRALTCESCFLVQLEAYTSAEAIFSDYAYFSSYADTWLEHARRYSEMAIERFGLGPESRVVELASNDGYLLRWFRDAGVQVLGVEPAANVAQRAIADGIPTRVDFFGERVARSMLAEGGAADLMVANNVLAHVPDLNDFVEGFRVLLREGGVATVEFPHLRRLIEEHQFDTIYHEHFSYFSFGTARKVFAAHGLRLFDVDELPTHGGSLRIYACHDGDELHPDTERVEAMLASEQAAGLGDIATYDAYDVRVREEKVEILEFLIGLKREGKRIAGYGAPAKGNTLLNYCGVGRELIDFTVDRSPSKQGRYLPGSHIPIAAPGRLAEERPDIVLILPWNLRDEITSEMAHVRDWGGRFAARVPKLTLLD
jgi:SAM-dependent methyltransferase